MGSVHRRSDHPCEGPRLRNAHVLLQVDVCIFVVEFDPGLPIAVGERNCVAELEIGGKTGFIPVEVEKGAAFLRLRDQVWPKSYILDAGYALKRLPEVTPVEAAARADIEPGPAPNGSPARAFTGMSAAKTEVLASVAMAATAMASSCT